MFDTAGFWREKKDLYMWTEFAKAMQTATKEDKRDRVSLTVLLPVLLGVQSILVPIAEQFIWFVARQFEANLASQARQSSSPIAPGHSSEHVTIKIRRQDVFDSFADVDRYTYQYLESAKFFSRGHSVVSYVADKATPAGQSTCNVVLVYPNNY